MDREGTITLLSAILAGTPSLPRAACIGHHALYDEIPGRPTHEQRRERHQAAVTVCSGVRYGRGVRAAGPIRRCFRRGEMTIPIAGSSLVSATIFQDHL